MKLTHHGGHEGVTGSCHQYLTSFIEKPNTDIVFCGYQGAGTPGRVIQRNMDWVELNGKRYSIHAKTHALSGYSAHADQQNLLDFVGGMAERPGEIALVHGEDEAKAALKGKLEESGYDVR
jgi:metallo-beta-lactamase family protein